VATDAAAITVAEVKIVAEVREAKIVVEAKTAAVVQDSEERNNLIKDIVFR
jgi:hypothetical protein